jgi:hypothetical protein
MTELRLGDEFIVRGKRYMLDIDSNSAYIVRKVEPPVVTAFGWTPGQWFIAANVMSIPPDSLHNIDAFIDLQREYVRKSNKEPYVGYPLVDNITSMFLAVSGVELPGERKPPF